MQAFQSLSAIPRLGLRRYASTSSSSALVFLEHRNGKLNDGSLNALSAAQKLGCDIHAVLAGSTGEDVAQLAKQASK